MPFDLIGIIAPLFFLLFQAARTCLSFLFQAAFFLIGWRKKDHLSTLPAEILVDIFEIAGYTTPLSRKLLVYTQKQLYDSVMIVSHEELYLFMKGAEKYGGLVSSLAINMEPVDLTAEEAQSIIPHARLVTFFSNLTSVRKLEIVYSINCIAAVLQVRDTALMPTLNSLRLSWPNTPPSISFNANTYASLNAYPNLERLNISTCLGAKRSWAHDQFPSVKSKHLNHTIKTLEVLVLDQSAIKNCFKFFAFFTGLQELLFCIAPDVELRPQKTFRNVNQKIQHLHLGMLYRPDAVLPDPILPLDNIIETFSSLKTLSLSPGSYTLDLFPKLQQLPLTHLSILHPVNISFTSFASLLTGPDKITTLKHLHLEMWEDPDPEYDEEEDEDFELDWERRSDFTLEDGKMLVELAEREGVHMCGSLSMMIRLEIWLERRELDESQEGEEVEVEEDDEEE